MDYLLLTDARDIDCTTERGYPYSYTFRPVRSRTLPCSCFQSFARLADPRQTSTSFRCQPFHTPLMYRIVPDRLGSAASPRASYVEDSSLIEIEIHGHCYRLLSKGLRFEGLLTVFFDGIYRVQLHLAKSTNRPVASY
jgi:hypothetical protein